MATVQCKFYQFGHCRFGEHCRYEHIKEVCADDNCEIFNCLKRHPKACRYYREFGRCKFGVYCNYHHTENSNSFSEPSGNMANVITALENENKNLGKKIELIENKNAKLEKKLKYLEKRLVELKAVIATDSTDDDLLEDGEESKNLCQELKNLIAKSEQIRDFWEKSRISIPEIPSLVSPSSSLGDDELT